MPPALVLLSVELKACERMKNLVIGGKSQKGTGRPARGFFGGKDRVWPSSVTRCEPSRHKDQDQ